MKKNSAVTFDDIAAYTSFSKTTVSRYFNAPDTLTPASREKIAHALDALGYQENKVGRILASGKTELIGILTPRFFHQFYSYLISSILDSYRDNHYKFIVFTSDGQAPHERKAVEEMIGYRVEGLIDLSHAIPSRDLSALGVPVVTVEREAEYVCSVDTNNYGGGELATGKLIRDGCQALVHINSLVDANVPGAKRTFAFEDLCRRRGVPFRSYLRSFADDYADTSRKIEEILAQVQTEYAGRRVGIFASSDTFAQVIVNQLVRQGRRIPEEFEVVGFDDSPDAAQAVVPMTTISQNIGEIARTAMTLLEEQIAARAQGTPLLVNHVVVEPALVTRETTLPED